ncbi:MAG: pilus assembly protein PilM [Deltaproteobacteria bacterium]|nr:pilus assembly protein PilM [Deltaproteobacteria bacterium]
MPQKILAIDTGSYSIKLAQAERSLGEFRLTDFYEIPLSAHDVLTREQQTTALLNRFFEEHPMPHDTAITSMSGLQCSFRSLEFPFTQTKKIDSAIEFELENYVPIPIEDLVVDYVVTDKSENSSKALAAYAPQAEIAKQIAMLANANSDPRFLSIESIDLANLFHSGLLPPEGTYILLDLGHSKTNLCLMQGAKLRAVRTLSMGGRHITQAIAKQLNVDLAEAERLKVSKGRVSAFDHEDELSEVIQKVLDDLLVQVRQTLFSFYEKGEKTIEAVYLCGGTSKLSGIDQYISTRLRLNVSPLDVLDVSYTQIKDPESVRAVIAPCMAMIFRTVYPTKTIDINFRRGEFAYKRDLEAISSNFRPIAIMATLVVMLGISYVAFTLYTFKNREKKMNKSVASLLTQGLPNPPKKLPEGAQAALSFVNSRVNEANDRVKKLEGDNAVSAFEIMRLISTNLPSRDDLKLDIDDMSIDADHARLEGRTTSYEAVDKVKASLEKVTTFKNVQTGNVRKGVQDEIKFSLSFDIANVPSS